MGMFDYITSSCDLGEQFTNVSCQTKDIEDHGFGGTMTSFWINPAGRLFYSCYRGTSNFILLDEEHPDYNPDCQFLNYQWEKTGSRGRFISYPITKYIKIYPERWDGVWDEWPTLKLHFKEGKLLDYTDVTSDPCL